MLPRSFLYVPGSRPELFAKAARSADAVILDLEDAVPAADKDRAREEVASWLEGDRSEDAAQAWARVSADALATDLHAVVRPGLTGIVLAKCSAPTLAELSRLADELEAERGLEALPVVGLIEDAAALVALPAIAAHPRLTTLGIGEVDLLGDLRAAGGPDSAAAAHLRMQVVVHCAAAGLAAPVAPTSTDFRDLDDFRRTTRDLVALGFRSRTAIHPSQVPVIHEVLTPDAIEAAAARDVLDRYETAAGGVTLDERGRLIDAAVIRAARETLARAALSEQSQ